MIIISIDTRGGAVDNSGVLSSGSITSYQAQGGRQALGSTVSAEQITVQAGRDIGIIGSDLVATQDLNLLAGRDIAIEAGQNSQSQEDFRETRRSGLFGGGGLGFTIGSQQMSTDVDIAQISAAASTLGNG